MHVKNPHNDGEVWFVVDIEREATAVRKCARCDVEFKEADNVGRYRCAYHPGWVRHGAAWSCCDRPYIRHVNNGCKRCDHTEYPYRDSYKLRMVNVGALKRLGIEKPLKESVKEVFLLKDGNAGGNTHDDYVLIIKTFED